MNKKRIKIPKSIEAQVLVNCRRRCCICFGLNGSVDRVRGHIAHLDHDPGNNDLNNLAYLCPSHHDEYDTGTSHTKGISILEVKKYREELHEHIQNGGLKSITYEIAGWSERKKWKMGILGTAVGSIIVLLVTQVFKFVTTPTFEKLEYESHIQDEYFVRLGSHFEKREEAEEVRKKLIELSRLAGISDAASGYFVSTGSVTGFDEDQIVVVRSLDENHINTWNVGLDLVYEQGEKKEIDEQIRRIKIEVNSLCVLGFHMSCDEALENPIKVEEELAGLKTRESSQIGKYSVQEEKDWWRDPLMAKQSILETALAAKDCWSLINESSIEYYDWQTLRKMYPKLDYQPLIAEN